MKKLTALLLTAAVISWVFGPVVAVAEEGMPVSTGLVRDTSGGETPIVKAKWEAYGAADRGTGAAYGVLDYYMDEKTVAGAQFLPSGQKDVNTKIAICAVVTDPDGLADIDNVYADVFYPEGVELGESHVPLADQSGEGCGALMQEDTLRRLTKDDGIELFCNKVRNENNNLPTFNENPIYDYDEICAADGELMKETAAVYCATKDLSYEDPDGVYEVWAVAQDQNGLQGILENSFTYLPLTAFETDFSHVNYGKVRLNTHKIISGDLTWDDMDAGKASVRNVGNTRLAMRVWQDDMGLGMTDGVYNVKYDARVGSEASFAKYWPEASSPKTLADELDLSELDEMDFSILITKFPPTGGEVYDGTMVLSALKRAHLECECGDCQTQ